MNSEEQDQVIPCNKFELEKQTIAAIALHDHNYAGHMLGNSVEVRPEFGTRIDQQDWKVFDSGWNDSTGNVFTTDGGEPNYANDMRKNANESEMKYGNDVDETFLNKGGKSAQKGKTNSQYNTGALVHEVDLYQCKREMHSERPPKYANGEDTKYVNEIKTDPDIEIQQQSSMSCRKLENVEVNSSRLVRYLRQRGIDESVATGLIVKVKERLRERLKQTRQDLGNFGSYSLKYLCVSPTFPVLFCCLPFVVSLVL